MAPTTLSKRRPAPLRVAAQSLTVLAVFPVTALLCAALLARLGIRSGAVPLGVLCALVIGLFVTVFHVRRESITLPCADREAFLQHLGAELGQLGYEAVQHGPDALTFRPGFTSFLFGGSVRARVGEAGATLTGPKVCLEIIHNRLRLHSVVDKAQHTFWDSRVRHGKRLLKRVQIAVRVPAGQWQRVYDDVIEVLRRDGAEVCCDVSLLAQGGPGVLENTVDVVVRERLRQLNLQADIHKEYHSEAEPAS
jgi:hypothetical protein